MKISNLLIFNIIVIICTVSCQTKNVGIKQTVEEWQGKEIYIPANVKYKVIGKDTICPDIWNKSYKILTYIDSIGCVSCQLDLYQWKQLIDSCAIYQPSPGFLFVVCSSDYTFLEQAIIAYNFNYPLIYDEKNDFDKLNHFPPRPLRTFLLDKDNKIQLIGSPIDNPKMWELYKKVITQSQ